MAPLLYVLEATAPTNKARATNITTPFDAIVPIESQDSPSQKSSSSDEDVGAFDESKDLSSSSVAFHLIFLDDPG